MYLSCTFFLLLLKLLLANSQGIVCRNTDKCICINVFSSNTFEYQCPSSSQGSKTIIHLYPDVRKLTVDCNSTDVLDETVLPNENFGFITKLHLLECPIPKNGFKELVRQFNLTSLKYLEYKAQSRDTLRNKDLEDLNELKKLELHGNNLTLIDENIFKNTPHLTELMLDQNNIELKNDIFINVPNLVILSLYGNNIDHIPIDTFKNLSNLETLSLWRNNLKNFETGVFDYLRNLKTLELSLNKIETLSENIFSTLTNLVNISLLRNNLKKMSRSIFENCTNLEWIRMDENPNLNLIDDVFSNFSYLKSVSLSNNELEILSGTLFAGSVSLKTISLNYNRLENVPKYIFKDLRNLKKLYLNNNRFTSFQPEMFSSLESLEYLYLQNNFLNTLHPDLLKSLKNLKEINLSYNKIATLHPQVLSRNKNLLKFFMSHNQFDFAEPTLLKRNTPFATFSMTNLKEVDLSYNRITRYPYELNEITTMEEIKLQHNAIGEIRIEHLKSFNPEDLQVNLDFNNISLIDFTEHYMYEQKYTSLFKTVVKISHNPIFCDCQALDFVRYIQEKNHPVRSFLSLEFGLLDCSGPYKLKERSVKEIPLESLTCSLDHSCTNNKECDCMYRSLDRTMLVNCSGRNLTIVPELTLSNITSRYDFVDYNQTEVHLERNQLEECPSEYDGYNGTTKLYLQQNNIKNITWIPTSLETLNLTGNALRYFDATSLKLLNNSRLQKLNLGNNPWTCDCETKNFSLYLRQHIKQIDIESIKCNVTGKRLVDLNEKDLCPLDSDVKVVLALIILSSLLVIMSAIVFYYKYQKEILVWLYAYGFGCCIAEETLDEDKIYDAFLSFSHKDEDFVTENLVPVLEGGDHPYRLCIHMRDFIPGELIQSQIFDAVRDSRKTLVILSSNFLESVWGKMEFKTAHTAAMLEGVSRVIIIIYGDVDMDSLDDELKTYMKTNTYIKWGDRWFWEKLRFALRGKNRKENRVSRRHFNMMRFIDDKFQLVRVKKPSNTVTTQPVSVNASNPEGKCLRSCNICSIA